MDLHNKPQKGKVQQEWRYESSLSNQLKFVWDEDEVESILLLKPIYIKKNTL